LDKETGNSHHHPKGGDSNAKSPATRKPSRDSTLTITSSTIPPKQDKLVDYRLARPHSLQERSKAIVAFHSRSEDSQYCCCTYAAGRPDDHDGGATEGRRRYDTDAVTTLKSNWTKEREPDTRCGPTTSAANSGRRGTSRSCMIRCTKHRQAIHSAKIRQT